MTSLRRTAPTVKEPEVVVKRTTKTKIPPVVTIDFETEAIEDHPRYPPKPVSMSIKMPGKKAKFYSWGHPCENNCTREDARRALLAVWESSYALNMHHAKFDYDVARVHFKLKELPWERLHDTMYLLFLVNPHAVTLQLKPASELHLGMPPEERDDVKDWILERLPPKKHGYKPSEWGKFICKAPGKVVEPYCNGDTERSDGLYYKLYPEVLERGMGEAYDRERRIMPILLRNEEEGIRVDHAQLAVDREKYGKALEHADNWIRKTLKAPNLNIDSDDELAAVLDSSGLVTDWVITKTGKKSTSKKNMTTDKILNPKVASVLGYRSRLSTCVSTFYDPWLEMAGHNGGIINTNWNQVRQPRAKGFAGARTGRLSSNPNFMNIPKDFVKKGERDGYIAPSFLKALPPLPLMRYYILPDKYGRTEGVFCSRDYSQQELRILAHFEDGALLQHYEDDPTLDAHILIGKLMAAAVGREFPRDHVKTVNFGKLYGMGLGALAEQLASNIDVAKEVSDAHKRALPGVGILEKAIKALSKAGEPIRTWGGREYYVEAPTFSKKYNRMQTFEYKLLNYLIQGSAADCTKEAIIRYDAVRTDARFLVTVHDEINISAPPKAVTSEMKKLREAMRSVEFDVPMLSDGKIGPRWGQLTKYKEAA